MNATTATWTESAAPSTLGRFIVHERIGAGGVGVVHRAVDAGTGLAVAVKTWREPTEECRHSLLREVSILERCQHPGVVRLHEAAVIDEPPWFAMELLEGASLRSLLRAWSCTSPHRAIAPVRGPSSRAVPRTGLARVVSICRALCRALAHIHGGGVIHCDLKPENVFVRPDDGVVLLDFGAARMVTGGPLGEGVEWATYGTLPYMAPECRVGAPFDHRADLFSLGCILHEALTGHPPADAAPWRRPHEGVGVVLASVPPLLREFVSRLTAIDPAARPETAAACEAVLGQVQELVHEELRATAPARMRRIEGPSMR